MLPSETIDLDGPNNATMKRTTDEGGRERRPSDLNAAQRSRRLDCDSLDLFPNELRLERIEHADRGRLAQYEAGKPGVLAGAGSDYRLVKPGLKNLILRTKV